MKKLRTIAISAVMVLGISMTAVCETPTTNLAIHLEGFDSDQGRAMVAITDSEKDFNSDEKPYVGLMLPILNREVNLTLALPFGDYAVKVYHDENGNEQLDTLVFGIPKEKYGFSNDARGYMGPPSFDQAKITLNLPRYSLKIRVQ